MAIEKMVMLNLVGPLEEINPITRIIVMLENVHIVNAMNEIDESNFTIGVIEENIHELVEMSAVTPYRENTAHKSVAQKINKLMEYLDMELIIEKQYVKRNYDFQKTAKEVEKVYQEVDSVNKEIQELEERLENLKDFEEHIKHLKGLDIDFEELNNLKFFNYKIGILSRENRLKIKKNYENISAIVLHIGSDPVEGEVYMIIYPQELETENERVLRSLNFQKVNIPKELSGRPDEAQQKLEDQKEKIKAQINELYNKMQLLKGKYGKQATKFYSQLKMEEETSKIKNETACTNNFFYLAGWVPQSMKETISDKFEEFGESVLVTFKNVSEVPEHITPPTKMKNNRLLKPFEVLIHMYGIPSYNEIDPTFFLSITYMFLFGAMFGDVGQGLVLLLAGLFLHKKIGKEVFGEIFIRLGSSSIIFGFLYGSVFGFEHILPAILIRPIENINQILIASVVLGVILLVISFVISILNAVKQKNLKEGLFGRNGLAGLIFYILLLIVIINIVTNQQILPNKVCYILMAASMVIIVIREPLSNFILGKEQLYEESASGYYTESGFEVFETILSMLSGTLSFIRVGAFALNHVGLFIAFHTIADLTGNLAGSIIIYIVGNIIIIGLEGLIVFIQGLRLEYYEMFSKYYKGEGVLFNPSKLNFFKQEKVSEK